MHDYNKFDTEALAIRLKAVIEKFGDKARFVHPNTILNFLKYLNSFKDRKKKEEIYFVLSELIKILENLEVVDIDSKIGAQLFDEYLGKLTNHYNVYMGFWIFINWYFWLILMTMPIFFMIIFQDGSLFYGAITFLVVLAFYTKTRSKIKNNKVYGIFY